MFVWNFVELNGGDIIVIVGMDFGTTNSGMAVYDGREIEILPLDPANENPRVLRTALYVTNEQEVMIGRNAIDRYFEHNVGRSVRIKKVWVGEIEVVAWGVYFIQDIYVWADVMSPGRLFLSFKTNLRDHEYAGTVIGQSFYPLESLVTLYLTVLKQRAERHLGRELREVVLGRPVRFSTDPKFDRLAQERLLRGAFQAGYERVYLQPEPIAAAYDYASRATRPENILIFDFGGGTLDITIMHIDGQRRDVLATGGIPVAGDVFDQKIVRAKLPKHFGEGSTYGARDMPSPQWIYDLFANWQTILELQTPKNINILREMEQGSARPYEIRGLINLVSGNYGLHMFDVVEKAKRELSDRFGTMIKLSGPEFNVLELTTRREFENIIRQEITAIDEHLDEVLAQSGLQAAQIGAVIRTGGSSEIPVFQAMLQRKFGEEKLKALDTFSSVTAGLGILGHQIQEGLVVAKGYTTDDLTQAPPREEKPGGISRPGVKPVNLDLLKRRIMAEEAGETVQADAQRALVLLSEENVLQAAMVPASAFEQTAPIPLPSFVDETGFIAPARRLLTADIDDTLLLVTSRYRFLLVTVRQLLDGQALGMSLADLYHFKSDEKIFTVARWEEVKAQEKFVIVTSIGYVRSFPTQIMVNSIEAPVPWSFDEPLPGWPTAILGANKSDEVVMVMDTGRAVRLAIKNITTRGFEAFNKRLHERVVGIVLSRPGDELLLVTQTGHARRFNPETIPLSTKPRLKGKVISTRKRVCGLAGIGSGRGNWLLTQTNLTPIDPLQLPDEGDTTKTHLLRQLGKSPTISYLF